MTGRSPSGGRTAARDDDVPLTRRTLRLRQPNPLTFGALLLLALGLAMDAAAVSAARGVAARTLRVRHVLFVAGCFGGFQALMPAIGWMLGARLGTVVDAWAHWIAFGVLSFIGVKMVVEARRDVDASPVRFAEPFAWKTIVVLGIATSVDALAAGFMLPMLNAPFFSSLATIGITAALLSAVGLFLGRRLGARFGKRLETAGGLLLIGLGFELLFEHLVSS